MSVFGGLIFTNRGRNLQAKAQTGVLLNFTRIAVGDGDLAGSVIADLTALKHEVKSLGIARLRTLANGKALVGTVLSNQALVTGFYFRELGVFAQDPDLGEILYCYGNAGANAEYIPAGGGPDVVEKNIDVITIIGNASSVNAVIDESLVFASAVDLTSLQALVDAHMVDTSPHEGILAVLGLNNQALNKLKAATIEVDTRGTTYAYNAVSGYLETIAEKDGATTVKTTAFTYNADGTINTMAETAGGVTVTTTYTYTDGKITSDAKVVA